MKLLIREGKEEEFLMLRMKYKHVYDHIIKEHYRITDDLNPTHMYVVRAWQPIPVDKVNLGCAMSRSPKDWEALRILESLIDPKCFVPV